MDSITEILTTIYDVTMSRAETLTTAPFDPNDRAWVFYGFGALLFAYGAYVVMSRKSGTEARTLGGFFRFLFPTSVWSNPSAWLDLRFFFFNFFTGKLLHVGLSAVMIAFIFQLVSGASFVEAVRMSDMPTWKDVGISIVYMCVLIPLADLSAYFLHFLQHKVPFLWEFHKVHHSPEVMHPISNYRDHPFDNVAFSLVTGFVYGSVLGGASVMLGYIPNMPAVLGVPLLIFLFDFGGYHLRHSHVWIRWPGKWSMVFPSPAHHHVHHSRHPEHLDKNFAFMFPAWDVLFKTYHMPEDDRDIDFGIFGMEVSEYNSIWNMYYIPFRNIYRKLTTRKSEKPDVEPRQEEA